MFEGPEGLGPQSDANILARILTRNASLLQCAGSGVFIWDEDKHSLQAMAPFVGVQDDSIKGLEFPVGGTVLGNVVMHDKHALLEELSEGNADESRLRGLGVQNALAVPLAVERRNDGNDVVERSVFGVCCAFNKYYGRAFDQEDARLLSMMARQVSAVLVTSNLYWKALEGKRQIAATIESMSVGLIAISSKGTITQLNAAARRALSLDTTGWYGRSYEEVVQNAQVSAVINAALAGEPVAVTEIPLPVEGEEHIYRVQSDSIAAEEGQSMGWVIVLEDVTDIRQAEQMMAAFVDMVSHELRTPLTSIRGFVATLIQAGEGSFDWETQSEFLQIVDTEAERLGQMIDDLLNIARIKGGRGLQFAFGPTDLESLVNRVVRLQSQGSFMKGHQLAVEITGTTKVRADEGKVEQVLNNLLSNSLKYSPNGGTVTVRLRDMDGSEIPPHVSPRPHGPGVVLSVRDQGMGIPKEQLPKMFGQFFRVEGSHMHGIKGTGLGLWLTKHLVEGHGGPIWVESDFGHGTEFFFWLPIDPAAVLDGSDNQGNGHH